MKLLFALLFVGISFLGRPQFKSNPVIGGQGGLVFSLGTHQQKIGLTVNIFYHDFFYQFNAGTQISFHFNSYGGRKKIWENRTYLGGVLLAGKRQQLISPVFGGLQHQTPFNWGLAYNYLWYFDEAGTSQRSGAFGLHLKQFFIAMENDVFGGQARDRFRTAILYAHYRTALFTYFTECYIWTGETRGSTWIKAPSGNFPYGYRELTDLPYGKTSHGIWSFGVHAHLFFQQQLSVKIGVDSEGIRNLVQNRFGHDLIFLPGKIKRNTPHYPMLGNDGCPVFDKKEKRKDRFFFSLSLNDYLFN